MDFESETFVAEVAPVLAKANYQGDHAGREGHLVAYTNEVSHALRAEGFDASEDGSGRGTPLVSCYAFNARQDPIFSDDASLPLDTDGTTQAVVTETYPIMECMVPRDDLRGGGTGIGTAEDPMFTLQAAQPHGIALGFAWMAGGDGTSSGSFVEEAVPTLQRSQTMAVQTGWAVRRLTPLECERLQGFPDGWTDIPFGRGKKPKPAADGPRYKACGNSMAVPVMRFLGRRIEMVDAVTDEQIAATNEETFIQDSSIDSFLE
jgi:DNA (cytosine-5)-methyltransferase 1